MNGRGTVRTKMDDFPKFMEIHELSEYICLTTEEILESVAVGDLPRPQTQGRKKKFVWRWDQVDKWLSGGPESSHRVYFVRTSDFIKIGFTTNLPQRLESLPFGTPHEVTLLHDMPGSFDFEVDMHRKFKHLRVKGEWFRAEQELLDFIEELKNEQGTNG
jgi:hypothetical protein